LQPPLRTRKRNDCIEDATFGGALKCFSNKAGTKSIMKKIGVDVIQFLLAHGFQVLVLFSKSMRNIYIEFNYIQKKLS